MTITSKPIKNAPNKAEIKKLYLTAFPKEERLPWWLMRFWPALKRSDLTAYYDGATFCGFTFTATAGEILYVMFFAVDSEVRGQGYGSTILEHLKQSNPGKTILLNVELLDETAPNNHQRIKRMAFYRKNGFSDTGFNIREVGGVFRVLSSTGKMDADAYQKVFLKLSYGFWKPKITDATCACGHVQSAGSYEQ